MIGVINFIMRNNFEWLDVVIIIKIKRLQISRIAKMTIPQYPHTVTASFLNISLLDLLIEVRN